MVNQSNWRTSLVVQNLHTERHVARRLARKVNDVTSERVRIAAEPLGGADQNGGSR